MSLESVQFSGRRTSIGGNTLEIAKPSEVSGSITVICGRNHSGKSFILKRIHRCILKKNENLNQNIESNNSSIQIDNVTCKFNNKLDESMSVVMICDVSDITKMMKDVSPIKDSSLKRNIERPLGKENFVKTDQFVQIIIKNCFERFRIECFMGYKGFTEPLDLELLKNENNDDYRKKLLEEIIPEKLYLTPRNSEIVKVFEKLTYGKLYYGVVKPKGKNYPTFQVYLIFNGDSIIPYNNWSDGQKVLFSLLIILFFEKPSILLFDEIENHLHPEYISMALEFAKQYTKQTIITTHHPHIIFSKHIDIVNYLEVLKQIDQAEPEEEMVYNRNTPSKTPIRGNILLNKGYSKLLSTYKLFDSYDTQLLKLSSIVLDNFNEILADLFLSLFSYGVKEKNERSDIQSEQLYRLISNKIEQSGDGKIDVLEYGTGKGRMIKNLSKIAIEKNINKIQWWLYEPFENQRNLLRNNEKLPFLKFIRIPETLPDSNFDVVFLANVLHELSPNAIANILSYSANHLKKDGFIIIIELFPLLKPEKYSVPLASIEWSNLAMEIGFKVNTGLIPIRNALHEAYYLQLFNKSSMTIQSHNIELIIKKYWNNQVLKNRIGEYEGGNNSTEVDEINKTLRLLTTITSISAYNLGLWNSNNEII